MKKTTLFVHDMVHNNPGLAKYESAYNNPMFLKQRGYDGKVFDLFECAQYGLSWEKLNIRHPERPPVFETGSEEALWVEKKAKEIRTEYCGMAEVGIEVYCMMDMIVFPKRLVELYPEMLDGKGRIDIRKHETRLMIQDMFTEMFEKFPELSGIYIRYGETYVGNIYGVPYHCGNNPILDGQTKYHISLIRLLQEEICRKHHRKLFYRSWGFGAFQYDPKLFREISDQIETHPLFYFCIKHTEGDFHRTSRFNQSLNVGKHQQVMEIQAAREYEGKGAYPNYIAKGVLDGFEELARLMRDGETKCLSDLLEKPDSLLKGIWIWSRGGGWSGPYINGKNDVNGSVEVENGSELWADVNAYVLSQWGKDPSRSDKDYAIQYAVQELGLEDEDAECFYRLLELSADAVLRGRGTAIPGLIWEKFWTRDQNIAYSLLLENIRNARNSGCLEKLLKEKEESVQIWKQIVELAEGMKTQGKKKEYIVTTCKYGCYLYALYETIYRANALTFSGEDMEQVHRAIEDYDDLWEKWKQLYKNSDGCPTLFEKEDVDLDLLGYRGNRGLDSALTRIRQMEEEDVTQGFYLDQAIQEERNR